MVKSKKKNIYKMVLIAMFIAIMMVMNFTPIGYITITGAFAITLLTIPVALGAVCTGITGGAILGFVFGLTSFLQAFNFGFMIDPNAAILFNENAFGYAITCFVPRIIVGLASGLVFSLFEKHNKINILSFSISAAIVPILNTSLFMAFYFLFYSNTSFGGVFMEIIFTILSLNFLVEFLATVLVGASVGKVIYQQSKKLRI